MAELAGIVTAIKMTTDAILNTFFAVIENFLDDSCIALHRVLSNESK